MKRGKRIVYLLLAVCLFVGLLSLTAAHADSRKWTLAVYGTSTSLQSSSCTAHADGSITLSSSAGKIVPMSTDGLTFYYTVVDPETENFTLEADVHVNEWTLSDGQEGFGLMVSDTVGKNGSRRTFWNNSILAMCSRVNYRYNGTEVTDDPDADSITMLLGVGTLVRLGTTAADEESYNSEGTFYASDGTELTRPESFTTETTPLETSCAALGSGYYNIIGNCTSATPTGDRGDEDITDLHLSIRRDNDGYLVTYSTPEGVLVGSKRVNDPDRDALTAIDSDHICVGLFVSRGADVTFSNIDLTIVSPEEDEPSCGPTIDTVTPYLSILSPDSANSSSYELTVLTNADGTVAVSCPGGVSAELSVSAATQGSLPILLSDGDNKITISFTPSASYRPSEYSVLSSCDTITKSFTVSYCRYPGTEIYVSPDGSPDGTGTQDDPLDIYTAVRFASAGQKIVLLEETYLLAEPLVIERGIDGTESEPIVLTADASDASRPVLDFGGSSAGIILAADYWQLSNFDITNTSDMEVGINICGNHNILNELRAYRNGNSGFWISTYRETDTRVQWPSDNLILNCTSYLNADNGYEDADGFAAKETVGPGNVFSGCIAAYNADDGFDLFAKVQFGCLEPVTIVNCTAFGNGYLLTDDGKEFSAGNGNGFKLGGQSLSGHHVVSSSLSFVNRNHGITSNTCPDVRVYNCLSYGNWGNNLDLYTSDKPSTDFRVSGFISYQPQNSAADRIKGNSLSESEPIFSADNFYSYGANSSHNSADEAVTTDWFRNIDTDEVVAEAISQMLAGSFGITDSGVGIGRLADGTITTNGYLELTEIADIRVGLYSGEAS